MTAIDLEDVAARTVVLEKALELSGRVAADHPLEPSRLGAPMFATSSEQTPAEQRVAATICFADWLIGRD